MADEWDAGIAQKSLLDHEVPPPGFGFAAASSRDRLRYGYPAEPDREAQPGLWAKWERNLHRPWRRVVPQYELQPARPLPARLPVANGTFSNWSGAVATPPAGKGFASASGTWIVPDAYPPPSAWNGHGYNDGLYNVLHWVGIGGDIGAGASNLLQAGTGTDVTVAGGAISVTPYFWFEWWNSALDNGYTRLGGFTVTPGDIIAVSVCTGNDTNGAATIANVTRSQYMTQAINPPAANLTLVGNTAEWIVEREGFTSGGLSTLADYGAMFFSDCLAGGPGFEANLSGAGLVNMVAGSATVSTALDVSATVLECYYGTHQP
jgi:Peptidase A4 family